MNRTQVIVGIDPGTTAAYAILDVEGKLIGVASSKKLELNSILQEVSEIGAVLAVGSDKKKCPSLIEKYGRATRARIITPKKDLSSSEKNILAAGGFENDHEKDALASARFAYKQMYPLLTKIDIFIRRQEIEHLREPLTEIVVKEHCSIKKAHESLTTMPEVKPLKLTKRGETSRLHLRIADLLDQQRSLSQQLAEKSNLIRKLRREVRRARAKKTDPQGRLKHKEHTIDSIQIALRLKEGENQDHRKEIQRLNYIISRPGVIVKKLFSLTKAEFDTKNNILQISDGDVVLVDDVNRYTEKLIRELNLTGVISHTQPSRSTSDALPFPIIAADGLHLMESEHFALVQESSLERKLAQKTLLKRVVTSYRNER